MSIWLAGFFLCAALLLAGGLPVARAEQPAAEDITAFAEISPRSPKHGLQSLTDRKYTTPWETATRKDPYVQALLPEDMPCASLYICFGNLPSSWEVQTLEEGAWVTLATGATDYLHTFLVLPRAVTSLRIQVTGGKKTTLLINELFLFGPGEVPDWVQRWEPAPKKSDLMVLVAHPDDELIFMGGTIPYYAVVKQKRVAVVYMTRSNTTRSSELLNGLWSMGVKTYPIIGPFGDGYSSTLKDGYRKWGGMGKVRTYVMETIRRLKPDIIVTHDVNGEYGHGAHRVCADAAVWCVESAADAAVMPESAQAYGVWDVPKLYLHLYEENPVVMDWRTPEALLDGRTPLEAAQDAYAFHVTQQNAGSAVMGTDFAVTDEGEYACSRFGLYRSLVGPDAGQNDFFENIP